MNETRRLQFQHPGTRGWDYFVDHTKGEHKYEAQASWNTPHGPERYHIWKRGGHYSTHYDVVRLKPSTGAWKIDNRPLKFSGYSLATAVRCWDEAVAIAEVDNARPDDGGGK